MGRIQRRERDDPESQYIVDLPSSKKHPTQQAFIDCATKRIIIKAGRRGGKAQPLTSKVYTPTGPVLMGDLKIGDKVLNPAGGIALVKNIFPQGIVAIFKLSFNDGTSVECTADH